MLAPVAANPWGKVLHVFDHSLPIADGYSFRSAEIIRFERRIGWRTVHITSAKQGSTPERCETEDSLDFYRTQPSERWFHRLPVVNQWQVVTSLRGSLEALISCERPVLLHVHSPCLNGLAALPVARRHGLPAIYEMRSLWEDAAVDSGICREGDLRYRLSRMLETYVCRQADHIVTICEGLRKEILSRGLNPDRVTVAPNSVDLDRFTQIAARDPAKAERHGLVAGKTFGFIGTFFPFEGLDVLLRAVPGILLREPQARFLLIGDGPEENRLRALARELDVENAIIFTGRVRHAEIQSYYDLIDILVYPRVSKRITELVTPLKPLEAMAKSKLVIASDVGGHREMIFPGQNGLLFKAGDFEALANSCLELLSRPQDWDALRKHGRDYVEDVRSWKRTVKIYDQIYRRILTTHKAA